MELMGGVVAFAVAVYGALYVVVLLAGVWWDTFAVCCAYGIYFVDDDPFSRHTGGTVVGGAGRLIALVG